MNLLKKVVLASCLVVAALGVWSLGAGAGPALAQDKERHPHIKAAIGELKEARKELKEAAHDFGGHRVKALEAVDGAIEQLEKCLKFDKK